jgi:hypothetical protein
MIITLNTLGPQRACGESPEGDKLFLAIYQKENKTAILTVGFLRHDA